MKKMVYKIIIMVILYLSCNYLIWFDIYPCLTNSYVHSSFLLGISPKNNLFIPLCVILPVLLFQPHMVMLYKYKRSENKKENIIYWAASLTMAAATAGTWLAVTLSYK